MVFSEELLEESIGYGELNSVVNRETKVFDQK